MNWFWRLLGYKVSGPWRTFQDNKDQWTKKHSERLKEAILNITFPSSQNVTKGKIVLLGPVQHGKSSFINSVLSVFKGRIVQKAPEGGGGGSLTLKHNQYKCGNFLLCDTMGLEVVDKNGFNTDDILFLLKGNIPNEYQFDPANPITEDTPGFKSNPTFADRVHCVVFCIDATVINAIQNVENKMKSEHGTKIKTMMKEINALIPEVPRIMILTKIDLVCEEVEEDFSKTFLNEKIKEVVKKASEIFFLPEMYIHPVKNFTMEIFPQHQKSILLMLVLKQALEFAKDCIKEFDTENSEPETGAEASMKHVD